MISSAIELIGFKGQWWGQLILLKRNILEVFTTPLDRRSVVIGTVQFNLPL